MNQPDVIVPIHNAPEQLADCLRSLHAHTHPAVKVLLLDDASSDPAITPLIQHWLERAGDGWSSRKWTENIGFVGTVNRGMEMTRGDVVLLNSDTRVTPGWLDGLHRCLASDARIATATPWTNNGEIASLPAWCQPNPIPPDLAAVAACLATAGTPEYPELPTAVGFCMAISRAAIDALGRFDQQLFGLGYGEENDFSMRARKAGWRNVLCDDVYVAHVGGCSFLPRGMRPDDTAMQKLLSRHPDYLQLVQEFIRSDPLAARRDELIDALGRAGVALTPG